MTEEWREATESKGCAPAGMKARQLLLCADGQKYYAKSTMCPKLSGQHTPAWLANELVYWEYAKRSALRVPPVARLSLRGELLVGSEYRPTRTEARNSNEVECWVGTSDDNRSQATLALLLDLALLNCDRETSAILVDEGKLLWFIDHDKSLWGDCRAKHAGEADGTSKAGDLGRIDTRLICPKLRDYVGDYLACKPLNRMIWDASNWGLVQRTWDALRQDTLEAALVLEVPAGLPDNWIPEPEREAMRSFLATWWTCLDGLLERRQGLAYIRDCLMQRQPARL
jgi:hypothetical protein